MAPTPAGRFLFTTFLILWKRKADAAAVRKLCTRTGGFVSHLGISDAVEVTKRAETGDHMRPWSGMR